MVDETPVNALTADDWQLIADWVRNEYERRKERRIELERIWKEIDRQLSMTPLPRQVSSGAKTDWYPELELPSQFQTLEVISADARRLLFPRNTEW